MRTLLGALGLAFLAGCAHVPPEPPVTPQESVRGDEAVKAASPQAGRPAAVSPSPPARAEPQQDPHTFGFEPMSVTLTATEQSRVAALVERAAAAQVITIRGFCDRAAVGNAKEAAIARAVAVRNLLAKEGVPLSKFRIRYVTEQTRHAAVVELQ